LGNSPLHLPPHAQRPTCIFFHFFQLNRTLTSGITATHSNGLVFKNCIRYPISENVCLYFELKRNYSTLKTLDKYQQSHSHYIMKENLKNNFCDIVINFPRCAILYKNIIQKIYMQISNGYIFNILQQFIAKLCSFTNFDMLFYSVTMNFPISNILKKFCLWSFHVW
jgi:hypothetical protein